MSHQLPSKQKKPFTAACEGCDERLETRIRQRPTLPHSFPCSTIGAGELNFRVRNGNGWILSAVAAEKFGAFSSAWLNFSAYIEIKQQGILSGAAF